MACSGSSAVPGRDQIRAADNSAACRRSTTNSVSTTRSLTGGDALYAPAKNSSNACLGSDDYRYEGGRVRANKPVRADYLDQVVWDHNTGMLADPQPIRAEVDQRFDAARTADPVARQRKSLDCASAKTATSIARMIEAYGKQLTTSTNCAPACPTCAREKPTCATKFTLSMPSSPTARPTSPSPPICRVSSLNSTPMPRSPVQQRQRVLRLLVKDVLIGPDKITIRHRIPIRERVTGDADRAHSSDLEDDHQPHCPLRWRRDLPVALQRVSAPARPGVAWLVQHAGPVCGFMPA